MKTAAGFVIFRQCLNITEYLLLQTTYGEHHWTPPKGHIDDDESDLMETALRETLEETGLKESDIKIYHDSKHVLNYQVHGHPKTVTYWLARLINPNTKIVLSDEHQDYKWLEIAEACKYAKHDNMQNMLKFFDNFVKKCMK